MSHIKSATRQEGRISKPTIRRTKRHQFLHQPQQAPESRNALQENHPHPKDSIKRGLSLTDDTYPEFYAVVEDAMKQRQMIEKTFRSISEKETVQKELSLLVVTLQDSYSQFSTTIKSIETDAGQAAFRKLIYRICSNYRRRRKPHSSQLDRRGVLLATRSEVISGSMAAAHLRTEHASHDTSRRQLTVQEDVWQAMVSITRQDGKFKALCRLCELTRGWPTRTTTEHPTIDDLDLERLIAILECDHAFNRCTDCLGWEEAHNPLARYPSIIDNDRQWKAVIAHMLRQRQALNFVVTARDDGEG